MVLSLFFGDRLSRIDQVESHQKNFSTPASEFVWNGAGVVAVSLIFILGGVTFSSNDLPEIFGGGVTVTDSKFFLRVSNSSHITPWSTK